MREYDFEVRVAPLCSELRLRLLSEQADLDANPELAPQEEPPYWAFCWASGQALARYVLDHSDRIRGRRVLDFGAGCGVAALAAARAGALSVVACDRDPRARAAIRRNAELNGVDLVVTSRVPRPSGTAGFDLLLAADVCYEPGNAAWLVRWAGAGTPVWLSDPGRPGLPREHLLSQARYAARTVPDLDESVTGATVYRVVPYVGACGSGGLRKPRRVGG